MKKIIVYERGGFRLFNPQDVVCLQAEDRYTRFFVRHKYQPAQLYSCNVYAVKLGYFEETLDPETFLRINRQTIINIHYVEGMGTENTVIMDFNPDVKLLLTGTAKETLLTKLNALLDRPVQLPSKPRKAPSTT